jgi:hypothetical protein
MGNETQQKATENSKLNTSSSFACPLMLTTSSNKKLVSRNKNFAIPAVEKRVSDVLSHSVGATLPTATAALYIPNSDAEPNRCYQPAS